MFLHIWTFFCISNCLYAQYREWVTDRKEREREEYRKKSEKAWWEESERKLSLHIILLFSHFGFGKFSRHLLWYLSICSVRHIIRHIDLMVLSLHLDFLCSPFRNCLQMSICHFTNSVASQLSSLYPLIFKNLSNIIICYSMARIDESCLAVYVWHLVIYYLPCLNIYLEVVWKGFVIW